MTPTAQIGWGFLIGGLLLFGSGLGLTRVYAPEATSMAFRARMFTLTGLVYLLGYLGVIFGLSAALVGAMLLWA